MKSFILISTLLLTSSLLSASEQPEKEKAELKKVMRTFASALELIQHGILYNKVDEMHKGAQLLRKHEQQFIRRHGTALEQHFPENPEFARSYAKSSAKRISKYTDRLSGALGGANDFSNIAASYSHILQECVGCHQKVRQW